MAKNRIGIIALCVLIIGVVSSFQNPCVKPSLETVIVSQLGKQEHPKGSNWGSDVQRYLQHVGYKVPAPWCAAFVRFCLDSAGIKSTINASSGSAYNKNNIVYKQTKFYKKALPGDVFVIYYASLRRIGHTGFVYRARSSTVCETIEGNSNDDGSREGYAVVKRKRSFHTLWAVSRWN